MRLVWLSRCRPRCVRRVRPRLHHRCVRYALLRLRGRRFAASFAHAEFHMRRPVVEGLISRRHDYRQLISWRDVSRVGRPQL